MQSLEAVISLMFFLSISSVLLSVQPHRHIDDSLYRLQLAEDAWRVLYLRGDFQDFDEGKRETLETDMADIGEKTSLCLFLDGTRFTNCRGGDDRHEIFISIRRTVIFRGKPEALSFSLGK